MYYSNIFSLGNSHAIRLPKKLLEALSFKNNERVIISATEDDTIIIKKAAPNVYRSIKDRFQGYTGSYTAVEWDTGDQVGKEIF